MQKVTELGNRLLKVTSVHSINYRFRNILLFPEHGLSVLKFVCEKWPNQFKYFFNLWHFLYTHSLIGYAKFKSYHSFCSVMPAIRAQKYQGIFCPCIYMRSNANSRYALADKMMCKMRRRHFRHESSVAVAHIYHHSNIFHYSFGFNEYGMKCTKHSVFRLD